MSMPNVTGFEEHPENPDWIRLNFADGSQSPYAQDPTGEFRKQASEVAQKLAPVSPVLASNPLAMPVASPAAPPAAPPPAAAPVVPLAGNPLAMPAGAPPPVNAPPGAPESIALPGLDPSAVAHNAPVTLLSPDQMTPEQKAYARREEGHYQANLQAGLSQQKAQEARDAQAKADAEQSKGARPYTILPGAPTSGGVKSTFTEQSSGLAPGDKKRVDAANQEAVDAAYQADQAALRARTEQVNSEWNRLSVEERQKLAEEAQRKAQEADFTGKVDAQTRKMEEITSRPIDPSQAFQGDAKWYAFMAGFGDSLQNFGAALAGRGPVANPGATIDRMIDRSVQLQTAQKEADFRAGKITADQLNADREYVRAQLATVGKQLAEVQIGKARTDQERMGLKAMGDKFEADRKAAIARNAAATARTLTTSGTVERTPVVSGGPSLFLGEKPDWDAVKAHSEKQAGADQVERGVSRLERAAGWTWDEKANNGAGGYIGADGKPVTANSADPAGVSVLGHRFSTGEGARELNGALQDMAAGGAKVKDPIGAVSDKSIEAETDAMAASTDEGILRAAERTRRNLRGMRAGIDSGFSPGVVNASRYRVAAEKEFQNNQPGLPRSRAPTSAEELRGNR
jgi:hypothetical protein